MGLRIGRWTLAIASLLFVAGVAGDQGPLLDPASNPLASPQQGTEDWLARVQRGLAENEYQASRNRVGLQAPNRAHELRTYFDASGIRVHDRTPAGSPELLSLSLSGVGRPDHMESVEPGDLVSKGARVEIRRPGVLEWYANSLEGLEQGFTVSKRFGGDGPLVLELAVEGARASRRVTDVIFQARTGRRLRYGKLAAVDAAGRVLVARLEVPEASRLRLVVEDEGAAYPVVIDPLLTATADARLTSDQFYAGLGSSVAAAGDVNGDGYADVIVGAPFFDAGETDEGAAFVFLGSATGIADGDATTAAARLGGGQAGAFLGWSLSGAGDVNGDGYADVVVGAPFFDAGETDEGAAFVFLGSATGIADGSAATAAAQAPVESGGSGDGLERSERRKRERRSLRRCDRGFPFLRRG